MLVDTNLKQLIEKYDRPGPRYTSYPTAREFHEGVGSKDYLGALGGLRPGEDLSLYIHVPFCEHRCTYCGCYVIPTRDRAIADSYLRHLKKEIEIVRHQVPAPARVSSVHLGGGTPTYLSPPQLEDLFESLRNLFDIEQGSEISVEIDPRVTTKEHLEALRRFGVNRLSLGVQDTSDEVQEAIGRHQGRESTIGFFQLCREAGFDSINIDLVYGLPLQTSERFAKTLGDVLALRPERIAAFGYAHVPWIRSNQKAIAPETLPGPRERMELYLMAHQRITDAGYAHIGLDHFALPGDELSRAREEGRLGRSFMGYTPRRDAKVVGLGVSSIGDLGNGYFQSEKKLSRYFDRIDEGDLPVERGFLASKDDLLRRSVIHDVLCNLKVDFEAFDRMAGVPFPRYFSPEMKDLVELEEDGLVEIGSTALAVKPAGRLFLRNIAMPFDRYLRWGQVAEGKFSRTV